MKKEDNKIKGNSVVQINENFSNSGWVGCLVQVDEVKSFGVQGWVQIPNQGPAYIRLNWEDFEYIGEAVMIHTEENED